MDGPVAADLGEMLLKRRALRVLTWWEVGFRTVFSKRGPIRTADDFRGLKIRSPQAEVFMSTFQALSDRVYRGLPADVQAALTAAAREATVRHRERTRSLDAQAKARSRRRASP
jgi:TRAP-type C4-dicarboxylate transport system substrate-binding protein